MIGEGARRFGKELRVSGSRVTRAAAMGSRSEQLFAQALEVIPGGVNSPVRSWCAVGGNPLFITRAAGASVTDADGRTYIDFVGSWGPMILGHAHPDVVAAVAAQARAGTSFGAPTALEVT